MKKLIFILVVLITLSIGITVFFALPQAKKQITTQLKNIGFPDAVIKKASLSLDGIHINEISLDQDGFNSIIGLSAEIFWPTYIFKKQIKSITIEHIKLSSVLDTPKDAIGISKNIEFSKLSDLPIHLINIKNITWDSATPKGAIRLQADTLIENNDGESNITTTISATQHQLSFSSQWKVKIKTPQEINIEGSIDQLSINYAPLNLHRGTAWLSYQRDNDEIALSAQLDGGNGKIFDVPAKNINLTIGKKNDYYPILFRAQASGIENVNFNADIHYADKIENQIFDLTLDIKNIVDFFTYLKQLNLINTSLEGFENKKTTILLNYLADKRFADGPIPFDLSIDQLDSNKVDGTFLIYPDSLDLRGTATSDPAFRNLLKSLFEISDDNITDDVIRIESNVKSWLLP